MHTNFSTLTDVLRQWAAVRPNNRAYVFVDEHGTERASLTFAELDQRARALASELKHCGKPGDRALLLFDPGLDFLIAFFGCLYAGIIAVPVLTPRRNKLRDSTVSIFRNCSPVICLTVARLLETARAGFTQVSGSESLQWVAIDVGPTTTTGLWEPSTESEDLAFLQYTSGSTSDPKGVMVSHRSLLANLHMIVRAMETGKNSTFVSWVPLHHDMGLILNVLHTLYLGSLCVLMAPVVFLQRPLVWLWAINRYGAEVAGAPNFAYDLCVSRFQPQSCEGLDLSSWTLAFNAAEPVRADTMRRFADTFARYGFRYSAFYPCYGMAEATVFMSGGKPASTPTIRLLRKNDLREHKITAVHPGDDGQAVAGCGHATVGERLVITNPNTMSLCGVGEIGEIWATGPHVARGYWNSLSSSARVFTAYLSDTGEGPFLRTGDLGFMEAGELFVTGRLKDVIIIRGGNYYPQDIEKVAEQSHTALRANCSAAFTVSRDDSEVLIIVLEVERTYRHKLHVADIVAAVRQAVISEFELSAYRVVLIKTGTIPKTSSGKIQRGAARAKYLHGTLEIWGQGEDVRPDETGELMIQPSN